jgi:hypothetical protein
VVGRPSGALRAWLRRYVGDPPHPAPLELPNGAEASYLASRLERHNCYMFNHFGDIYNLRWKMQRLSGGDISPGFPAFMSQEAVEKKLIPIT